jgi:hypothetical protein
MRDAAFPQKNAYPTLTVRSHAKKIFFSDGDEFLDSKERYGISRQIFGISKVLDL